MLKFKLPFILRSTAEAAVTRERASWTEKFAALALHYVRKEATRENLPALPLTGQGLVGLHISLSWQEQANFFNLLTPTRVWSLAITKRLNENGIEALETLAGFAIQEREKRRKKPAA